MFDKQQAPLTGGQYSVIRILLGSYLLIHFLHLLPYGTELFSSQGVLPANLSPLLGIIPNPLLLFDSPLLVSVLLFIGAICGLLLAAGSYDRVSSGIIVILLGWLYARNPLIANPSLPVVGWMLLAHIFIPTGAYAQWSSRGQNEKWIAWFYPKQIWIAAWVLLAVAYSYSGYTKLLSPSWVDGSAIQLVLENPLARDHILRAFLLELPPIFLQLLTWSVIVIELFFVLFCFHAFSRQWAWFGMLLIQFGFLVFLDFADLTFPMFLIHALTFDRKWIEKYRANENMILFYDGTCAFCNAFVRFSMSEDYNRQIMYSPLQGKTFKEKGIAAIEDDSIVVLRPTGELLHKSDAVIQCMKTLGGFWFLLAKFMQVFPKIVRDKAYDFVGRIRYKIAGKVDSNSCSLLPTEYSERVMP